MAHSYKTPGVYREDIFLKPEARLLTGVPGFIGFVESAESEEMAEALPRLSLQALHRKEEFAEVARKFKLRADSYLAEAVNGFFDNGGVRCFTVLAYPGSDAESAVGKALEALAPLTDLDMVAVPDAMTLQQPNNKLDQEAIQRVQSAVLVHCAVQGDRLAILDALPESTNDAVLAQRESITRSQSEPVNGALYYPWLKIVNIRSVPPCGHVAGIFARTDARVGVFKAPANEEVFGVLDLEVNIDNRLQDQLNPEGVNCLRAFPGRGIRVWGARTLSRDPNWRYINIRRLFLTVGRWIEANMPWAAFEPNTPELWVRIQRELNTYLTELLRAGALQGQTPEEAFYVKCDAETNPPEIREAGQVVTEIGLAPGAPAEFVVVRIIHRAGATEIS